ncbi:glutamine synthetase family protein [Telmatospirillum sp. J64-1]|uniref:glutamine synthetase family protein n=1 Tax=Telmatospirillum sp. J64-1 TaxID=2502183 RepID=UPI00115E6908|nr:glutamine synthetase family protein [Telmatospirillum sp. J64-1]
MTTDLKDWIRSNAITEVESVVPDMSGVARGKIVPAHKFLRSQQGRDMRLPESVFIQTVTGSYPEEDVTSEANGDVYLQPDLSSLRMVPWYSEPTGLVINDCFYADGSPVGISPRQVLKKVLALYDERGWKPIVAPELEFFLVKPSDDPDYPLEPPIGRSGRPETGRQSYGIDAVNEFDPLFDDIYDFCEVQRIDVDTLSHEAGAGQMEINFNHGEPLDLADQVFLFKRIVRQAALRHKVYATFMAKPMENEPGSAMHLHQNVIDKKTGRNLFSTDDGKDTDLFRWFIGGLRKYLPHAMLLFAPNVNSYRRLVPDYDAPINVHWGHDNRTVGLRVPESAPQARRVENRLAGADANPYLAIAGSLACGLLGIIEKIDPGKPIEGSAYTRAHSLPRHQPESVAKFSAIKPLRDMLGEDFVEVFAAVKLAEWEAYHRVVSSWEREYLLLNV